MSFVRTEYAEFVEITPRGEETMHIADAACECRPRLAQFYDGRRMLIHNSYDGRDQCERIEAGLKECYRGRMAA